MMNLVATHDRATSTWRVMLFPRAKHRPSFYFADGDSRLLLSPAAAEMGGLCTLPVERDFRKITREQIVQPFDEVTLGADAFDELTRRISSPT